MLMRGWSALVAMVMLAAAAPGAVQAQAASPAPAQAAARAAFLQTVNAHAILPHAEYGTIESVSGTQLALLLRSGKTLTVDASQAIASGQYSAPLFVGKVVVVEGSPRANGVFAAQRVSRLTSLDAQTPADR
jgi:hypothetical protein